MTRLRPYIILSITIAVTLTVAMSASANPQDRPPYVICQTSNYDPLESIQIVPVDNLNYNRREQIELSPNLLELLVQSQSSEESAVDIDRLSGNFIPSILLSPQSNNVLVLLGELHGKLSENRRVGRSILEQFDYIAVEGNSGSLVNKYTVRPLQSLIGSQIFDAMATAKSVITCDEQAFTDDNELPLLAFLECESSTLPNYEREAHMAGRLHSLFYESEVASKSIAIVGKAHVMAITFNLKRKGWKTIQKCSIID